MVRQSLERGWDVRAIVRRPPDPVLEPVRRGHFIFLCCLSKKRAREYTI